MTTGYSGTFAVNGTDFNQYPTEHGWTERNAYGQDGLGHQIYPQNRSYQMTWNFIAPADAQQIVNFYNLVSYTGTVVACLPQWGSVGYIFANYSGCVLQEPTYNGFYEGHLTDFKLLINGINTNQ